MPTSQGNHHPKPEPIKFGTSKKTYAFRPPNDRYPNWTWRMRIHSEEKLQYISIGRLKHRGVLKKMDLTYQQAKLKDNMDRVEKTTFSEIINMWYLDAIVPRLPTTDIRDEFKLSSTSLRLAFCEGLTGTAFLCVELDDFSCEESSRFHFFRPDVKKITHRRVDLIESEERKIGFEFPIHILR